MADTIVTEAEAIVKKAEEDLEALLHPAPVIAPPPTGASAPLTGTPSEPATPPAAVAPSAGVVATAVASPVVAASAASDATFVTSLKAHIRPLTLEIEGFMASLEDLVTPPGTTPVIMADVKTGLALIRKHL